MRRAWGIPVDGFLTHQEHQDWYTKLVEQTNKYLKSEKYRDLEAKRDKMRLRVAHGKVVDIDFKLFAYRVWKTVPMYKFDYDVDCVTVQSGKPVYWRHFIEQCILFSKPQITQISRPKPEPHVAWDNYSQCYSMTIENLFPDTTLQDFQSREFSEKFKKLQKKLPGYQTHKSRRKRTLTEMEQLAELDRETNLSDYEKGEKIFGVVEDGLVETKRRNNIKQRRNRLKKYVDPGGDNKDGALT